MPRRIIKASLVRAAFDVEEWKKKLSNNNPYVGRLHNAKVAFFISPHPVNGKERIYVWVDESISKGSDKGRGGGEPTGRPSNGKWKLLDKTYGSYVQFKSVAEATKVLMKKGIPYIRAWMGDKENAIKGW